LQLVLQAAICDCALLDPVPLGQDGAGPAAAIVSVAAGMRALWKQIGLPSVPMASEQA